MALSRDAKPPWFSGRLPENCMIFVRIAAQISMPPWFLDWLLQLNCTHLIETSLILKPILPESILKWLASLHWDKHYNTLIPERCSLPCFAECRWCGCNAHVNRDRGPQRQFSNPFACPLNLFTSLSATQWGEECSGVSPELPFFRKFPDIRIFWKERQYFRRKKNAQYALRRRQQGFWLS